MAGLREWIDSDNSAMQNLADAAVAVAAAEANNGGDATGNNDDESIGANGGNSYGNSAGGSEGTSLVLPPCNAFLRRCLYETIEDEYPGLILEKADMDPTHAGAARNQIRVIRMSDAEKKRRRIDCVTSLGISCSMILVSLRCFRQLVMHAAGNHSVRSRQLAFLMGRALLLQLPKRVQGTMWLRKRFLSLFTMDCKI